MNFTTKYSVKAACPVCHKHRGGSDAPSHAACSKIMQARHKDKQRPKAKQVLSAQAVGYLSQL